MSQDYPVQAPAKDETKALKKMINSIGLVDPQITEEFITLLKINEHLKLVNKHPELELAVSNLPPKFIKLIYPEEESAAKERRPEKVKSRTKSQVNVIPGMKKPRDSRTQENLFVNQEERTESKSKSRLQQKFSMNLERIEENLKSKKRRRKNKSTTAGLNTDLIADLDITGRYKKSSVTKKVPPLSPSRTSKISKICLSQVPQTKFSKKSTTLTTSQSESPVF